MSTITKHIVLIVVALAVGMFVAAKWGSKIPFLSSVGGQ